MQEENQVCDCRFARFPLCLTGDPCYLPRAHKAANYTEGHLIKAGRTPTWLIKKELWLIK